MSRFHLKKIGGVDKFVSHIASTYATTLRAKILIAATAGLVLASIVYTFASVKTERAIMREDIIKQAKVVTELASHIGELPLISENPEHISNATATLKNISEITFVAFYNKSMELLGKEGDIISPGRGHPPNIQLSFIEGEDHFDVRAPVFAEKTQEDISIFHETEDSQEIKDHVGWVRIGFSKAYMKQAERSMILRGLIIAAVFTLFSVLFIYKLFTVATRPLTMLSKAVKSVSRGKYPEINITSGDEIGGLTTEFNNMSRTIRDREDMLLSRMQLSAFVADTGMVLTQSDTLKTILKNCTDLMVRHFDAALARIWIYNNEENMLEFGASAGMYADDDKQHNQVPVGKFSAGLVAQDRQSHYGNDTASLEPEDRVWAAQNGIRSFSIYPLIVEEHLVGVMEMFTKSPLTEDVFDTLDSVAREIALGIQHKLIEWKIKDSLREKEVLLREIHHRVKNNMQVISSLLNFQTRYINDKQYITILNESQNRIKSMALIHEKLYRSEDLSNIDFYDYATSLANDLFKFYIIDPRKITLNLDISEIAFEIDTAIPCGLLINELLSNALKHAFPDGREGEISISLKKKVAGGGLEYELTAQDNGVGIPEDLDIAKTKSLGLQLISSLAEHQLQGKLTLHRTGGTAFNIIFKELKYKKRI
jgi:two-component sensor histidine kinase